MSLPVSTGADAKWVLWEEANASYGAPVSEAVTVWFDGAERFVDEMRERMELAKADK